jgi:hypothetical protein
VNSLTEVPHLNTKETQLAFFLQGSYQPFGFMITFSHFEVMYQMLRRQTTLIVHHLAPGNFAVDHAPFFCRFSAYSRQVLRVRGVVGKGTKRRRKVVVLCCGEAAASGRLRYEKIFRIGR